MKQQLLDLHTLVRKTAQFFGEEHNLMAITASVIIQNLALQVDHYSESDFQEPLDLLRLYAEFDPNDHILGWAYNEASMIVTNYIMERDHYYDDYEPEVDSSLYEMQG